MKVNMKHISELTGFSTATVSNALNNKKGVNAETAAKILQVAKDLGYYDDSKISKVKFVTLKKNGKVVEDTPFFTLMLSGIEQECRDEEMELTITHIDMKSQGFMEQIRSLQNDNTSALIILGTELELEDQWILDGITGPFIVVDYWSGDMSFNCVQINNIDSACTATQYLIEKGHEKIGYLKGNYRITPFLDRERGFNLAMIRAGREVNPAYLVEVGTTIDSACQTMKEYLDREDVELPTAFFADNDLIALGAMRAMQEKGIRIPEDVSIIGFDDLPFSAISYPPLTTVNVPKQQMGQIVARRLHQMLKGDDASVKIEVSTQFVERESVKQM